MGALVPKSTLNGPEIGVALKPSFLADIEALEEQTKRWGRQLITVSLNDLSAGLPPEDKLLVKEAIRMEAGLTPAEILKRVHEAGEELHHQIVAFWDELHRFLEEQARRTARSRHPRFRSKGRRSRWPRGV